MVLSTYIFRGVPLGSAFLTQGVVASPKAMRSDMSRGHFQLMGVLWRVVVVLLGMMQTHAVYALECVEVLDHWKVKHRDQSLDPIICSFHQSRNNRNGNNCHIDCSLCAGDL